MKQEDLNNIDDYDVTLIPKNDSEDSKTGVVIKGHDAKYLKAHKVIMDLMKKKGDEFLVNGIDVRIADVPANKPVNIEVKSKNGFSGKANLRFYEKNAKGTSTIMVSKQKGGDLSHVELLAINVIKFLLDSIIDGKVGRQNVEEMRKRLGIDKPCCDKCDKVIVIHDQR